MAPEKGKAMHSSNPLLAFIAMVLLLQSCGSQTSTNNNPDPNPWEGAGDTLVISGDTKGDSISMDDALGSTGDANTWNEDIGSDDSGTADTTPVEDDTTAPPPQEDISITPAGNHATFVSQNVPTQVSPGASFSVEITLHNMGDTDWSQADGYFLGSENPQDNFTWSTNRIGMENEAVVLPSQSYTFTATLVAPTEEGTYPFQWRMLQDAVEWFGETSENIEMDVVASDWPQYDTNPFVFDLAQPQPVGEFKGSLFVHDLNNDSLMDFIVTGPNVIGAYDHWGSLMWKIDDDIHLPGAANNGTNYPGTHAPGAIAGDMDGDGQQEVAYLTFGGQLKIRNGATGDIETTHSFPNAQAIAIANFQGNGDRDAVLQYSQTEVRAIDLTSGETLWHKTNWFGIEHSQVRVADMDGDGIDEVIGPIFLDHAGNQINGWDLPNELGTTLDSLDSLAIGDIIPGGPLEIAMAEQGGNNQTVMVNQNQIYWGVGQNPGAIAPSGQCATDKDPDKMAVGDFDPTLPGLEIFARSACGNHPWVHGSDGAIISAWNLPEAAPEGWLHYDGDKEYGIEEIRALNWDGGAKHYLLLKERHVDGKVAIVDAMTGNFLEVFDVTAGRAYAADIAGDSREEAVVLISKEGNGQIKVFWNNEPSLGNSPRPWENQHYRRERQNWNYYSP
jgi:hypothetical protein